MTGRRKRQCFGAEYPHTCSRSLAGASGRARFFSYPRTLVGGTSLGQASPSTRVGRLDCCRNLIRRRGTAASLSLLSGYRVNPLGLSTGSIASFSLAAASDAAGTSGLVLCSQSLRHPPLIGDWSDHWSIPSKRSGCAHERQCRQGSQVGRSEVGMAGMTGNGCARRRRSFFLLFSAHSQHRLVTGILNPARSPASHIWCSLGGFFF
jgi:hypothetical protein